MTSKNSISGEVPDLKKGTENAIIVVGGHDGSGPLNSSEAILFDRPCALPDLPLPNIYGPAVIMTEGSNAKTVVSNHQIFIDNLLLCRHLSI